MWRFLCMLALCGSCGLLRTVVAAPLLPANVEYGEMPLTAHQQLIHYSSKEFSTLLNETVIEGATLLQLVIDEVQAKLPHYYSQRLDSYVKFVANSARLTEIEELVDLLDDMIDMFEEPQLNDVLDATDDAEQLIDRLLRKHGMYSFEQALEQKVNAALSRIEQHIGSYLKSLSPPKRKREAQMISWFQLFQAETDIEKKTDLLLDMMYNLDEYEY